jgi:hypothetical protein
MRERIGYRRLFQRELQQIHRELPLEFLIGEDNPSVRIIG